MTDARRDILGAIRSGLGGRDPRREEPQAISARLSQRGPNTIPARGQGTSVELLERFVEMAREASATVEIVTAARVGAAVARVIASSDLSGDIAVAPHPAFDGLALPPDISARVRRGAATGGTRISLTPALAGIAETGTLLVAAGPETPNTLHLLPDLHIAVLDRADIVGAYEDAWARLRQARRESHNGTLPRAVTMITGPSRTSDIERVLQIGVHGPQRLHIVVVDGAGGE